MSLLCIMTRSQRKEGSHFTKCIQNSGHEWEHELLHKIKTGDKTTYRVLGAAGHDVFEFDFWHVVVDSWLVEDN